MLTQAIVIGMSPYQFWHEEPKLFFNYLEAYDRKKTEEYEIELQKINHQAWLHGWYIDYALKVNPAFGKSGKYIDKPIELKSNKENKEDNMTEEEKEQFQEKMAIAQFEQFGKYVKLYNETYHGEEDGN